MPFQRKSGRYAKGVFQNASSPKGLSAVAGTLPSYSTPNTTIRRHQYNSAVLGSGSILANLYQIIPILQMKRTFTASEDTPDAPSNGSNYETPDVMNGSYVTNLQSVIHVQNKTNNVPGWLSVFEIAVSFYDALVWNTLQTSSCPIQFDTTTTGPDHRGEVTIKTPSLGLFSEANVKNFRFQQRFVREIGKIYLDGNEKNSQVDIRLTRFPAKVRRVQQGTWYGIVLFNDSTINSAGTITATTTLENSFDEIPSDERFAYLS